MRGGRGVSPRCSVRRSRCGGDRAVRDTRPENWYDDDVPAVARCNDRRQGHWMQTPRRRRIRLAGECGIALALRLDPFRRGRLQHFDGVAHRHRPTQFEQHMHVIVDRVDRLDRTTRIRRRGRHVGMQRFTHIILQPRLAMPRAEHEVQMNSRKRLRHGNPDASRPGLAPTARTNWSQGRSPWWT